MPGCSGLSATHGGGGGLFTLKCSWPATHSEFRALESVLIHRTVAGTHRASRKSHTIWPEQLRCQRARSSRKLRTPGVRDLSTRRFPPELHPAQTRASWGPDRRIGSSGSTSWLKTSSLLFSLDQQNDRAPSLRERGPDLVGLWRVRSGAPAKVRLATGACAGWPAFRPSLCPRWPGPQSPRRRSCRRTSS